MLGTRCEFVNLGQDFLIPRAGNQLLRSRAGLQPRKPVGAAGAAEQNRPLVARELAAAAGENGRRLIKRARSYRLLLVESHVTRRLFGDMLRRISALPVLNG
jgi:hypothetical protein